MVEAAKLARYEEGLRCVKLGLTTPELFVEEALAALDKEKER
jgi:hypothetical protein